MLATLMIGKISESHLSWSKEDFIALTAKLVVGSSQSMGSVSRNMWANQSFHLLKKSLTRPLEASQKM